MRRCALWKVDRDAHVLRCATIWCAPEVPAHGFADDHNLVFGPGHGLRFGSVARDQNLCMEAGNKPGASDDERSRTRRRMNRPKILLDRSPKA
jgi:hypothetical protein